MESSTKTQQNILIAFLLNLGFSVFELIGGILTGCVAMISDSIHDFGDAISIGAAFLPDGKSRKKPGSIHSYGNARYSVRGTAITNLILLGWRRCDPFYKPDHPGSADVHRCGAVHVD